MSQPKRVQTSSKEGNLLLAISAFQPGQCISVNAAAKLYNVVPKSLYRRINGSTSREDYTLINKRLSDIKEEVIIQDILKLDA
jgi:aminopeptidase C